MFDKYAIKPGDDLDGIAKKFSTSKSFLQDINNSCLSDLRVGMEIIVPDSSKMYFNFYTIEAGDSLYGIARRFNINPSLLASLNGLNMEDYIYQEIHCKDGLENGPSCSCQTGSDHSHARPGCKHR